MLKIEDTPYISKYSFFEELSKRVDDESLIKDIDEILKDIEENIIEIEDENLRTYVYYPENYKYEYMDNLILAINTLTKNGDVSLFLEEIDSGIYNKDYE